VLLIVLLAVPRVAPAQRLGVDRVNTSDTLLAHSVRLRDGSTLIGRITVVTPDSVRMQLRTMPITVPRSDIAEVRQFARARLHGGEYWPENPMSTRLLFAQTAYPLERGEAYYTNLWLFIHGIAVGVTDRLTLGAGFTLIPGIGVRDNVFYVAPKLSVLRSGSAEFALGALLAWAPALNDRNDFTDENTTGGILYGVGSIGGRDSNASLGLGWWYGGGNVSSRPVVITGGQWRASRRLALISEDWLSTHNGHAVGAVSYGLRFLGERLSADFAFVNVTESPIFPGAPWLSIAVKF